jgi:deoxyribonuclease V
VSVARAREIQESLRARVIARDRLGGRVRRVAGTDVSFDRRAPTLHAAVVVLDARTLEPLEAATATAEAVFPYVPGFLSFREIPVLLAAFAKLAALPDLIVCDGHGFAHPRRFGLASHLGVLLDTPTVGCAKSVLVGEHAPPGARRGAFSALRDGGRTIGSALRTQSGIAPVFVSVGHRVSLASARRWALRLAPRFRLTEPVRAAHAECNRARRAAARSEPAGDAAASLR